MPKLSAIAALAVLLVGLAGAALALHGRGGSELLRTRQSHALSARPTKALSAPAVQALLRKVPEPVYAPKRTPLASVRCRPQGGGALRDPWSCELRYRSGTRTRYRVVVQPDGSYRAEGSGIVEGCCVKTPTAG